jgi:hypothetical protein
MTRANTQIQFQNVAKAAEFGNRKGQYTKINLSNECREKQITLGLNI